jgi:hypothetical protein
VPRGSCGIVGTRLELAEQRVVRPFDEHLALALERVEPQPQERRHRDDVVPR